MDNLAELLEESFEEAVEVRDRKALHRCVLILVEKLAKEEDVNKQYEKLDDDIKELRSDVKVLAEVMKKGFESVDKRFEDMNKRFEEQSQRIIELREDMNTRIAELREDMNKRFEEQNQRIIELREDMNKRFEMMFKFMAIGFTVITVLIVIFKFIR